MTIAGAYVWIIWSPTRGTITCYITTNYYKTRPTKIRPT